MKKIIPDKPRSHRYWDNTHRLFLQRMKEVNSTRPVDDHMTFIVFMHEVANGRIKMPLKGTS